MEPTGEPHGPARTTAAGTLLSEMRFAPLTDARESEHRQGRGREQPLPGAPRDPGSRPAKADANG